MTFTYALLTDEVSPELAVGLEFALGQGLGTVDIRSVGGVNFLSIAPDRQRDIARQIRDAGLQVGCFATPLLKWSPPGKAAATAGDQFGFDPQGRTSAELYDDACEAAALLGTTRLRIFSFLTYPGFRLADLEPDLGELLVRAERHGLTLHIENEPVCNLATIPDLTRAMAHFRHPRLRAILDIANAVSAGAMPSVDDIAALMPHVDLVHCKDYLQARRRCAPLGEGDVPFGLLFGPCKAAARERPLSLVIETHVPGDQPGATQRSLAGLRRLMASP